MSPRLQGRVDGALVYGLSDKYQSLVTSLCRPELPRVGMGIFYPPQGDYVGVDLRAGADQAMQHLLDSGYRRIALLLHQAWLALTESRLDAYRHAMDHAGLPHRFITTWGHGRSAAREAIKRYLAAEERPDAIFCMNDDAAIGCFRGLLDLGLRVPRDVAVVGCDGIEDTEYLETPLTTIVQPVEELCRLGWDYLQQRMADPDLPPQQTMLKARLAIRASSVRA